MKKKVLLFVTFTLISVCTLPAHAFDLKDIFGDKSGSSMLGNLIEGVFMKSNLTTKDLMGVWTTDQPAVAFRSEDLLKKAGGMATASAIESKLQPYFKQYGLTGAVLTVNADSTFTLKSSKLNLSGTIRQQADGNFLFSIMALGKIKIGEIPAFVQKTSKSMEVMFDSTKLISLLNSLGKVINIPLVSTASSLLSSYDGLYVGFGMNQTGNVPTDNSQKSTNSGLLDILKGKQTNQSGDSTSNSGNSSGNSLQSTSTDSKQSTQENKSTTDKIKEAAGNALKEILTKKKK